MFTRCKNAGVEGNIVRPDWKPPNHKLLSFVSPHYKLLPSIGLWKPFSKSGKSNARCGVNLQGTKWTLRAADIKIKLGIITSFPVSGIGQFMASLVQIGMCYDQHILEYLQTPSLVVLSKRICWWDNRRWSMSWSVAVVTTTVVVELWLLQ